MNRRSIVVLVTSLVVAACGTPLENATSTFMEQIRLGDPAAQQTYAENRELLESAEALPIWLDALETADSPQVRVWAATLIGNIGDDSALPALADAMSEGRDVRDAALQAIAQFDDDAAAGAFVMALESDNRDAQAQALAALARMGAAASTAVPAVAQIAATEPALIADTAINTLADLASDDASAALATLAMNTDLDMDRRSKAIQSLQRIDSDAASAAMAEVQVAIADEEGADALRALIS